MSTFTPENLISQAEAARLRGCTRQAILRLIQKGRFNTVTVGGRVFLNREDVLNYEGRRGRPVGSGGNKGSAKMKTSKNSAARKRKLRLAKNS